MSGGGYWEKVGRGKLFPVHNFAIKVKALALPSDDEDKTSRTKEAFHF